MLKSPKQLAWLIASSSDSNFFSARESAKHLFQGSRAVKDKNLDKLINDFFIYKAHTARHKNFLDEFQHKFYQWVTTSHSLNSVQGLDHYKSSFSNGTTQAFDSFYLRHSNKRFRCFVGEYFYHIKSWISLNKDWLFINNVDDIGPDDAVVISAPFCDTGSMHPEYQELLEHCSRIGVPVLVDCCYFPISGDINFNFSYECIDTVCFSLSKAFAVANYRIGVRYTKASIQDGQSLLNDINYNNNFAATIGLEIIKLIPADYIFSIYREKQQKICRILPGLTISNCAIFAVGDSNWDTYSRRNLLQQYQLDFHPKLFVNRVCLNSIYENWGLFEHYAHTAKI